MSTINATLAFKVDGLDCAEEVALLKRELLPLVESDEQLAFDLLNAKLLVTPGASNIDSQAVIEAVARTGMRAEVWRDAPDPQSQNGSHGANVRLAATIVSGLFCAAGFAVHAWNAGGAVAALSGAAGGGLPLTAILLYLVGIAAGVWMVAPKAWRAAVAMRPDMNLLMLTAVVGAAGIGDWFEAAAVAFLFSVSLLLESWSVGKARRAIAALMELTPLTAHLCADDGSEQEVAAEQVAVGAMIRVRPGEKIPLDGKVVQGASDVNQAPITGESAPVSKTPGAEVFAGTINGSGLLQIQTTKPAADTTLARIIRMVGEAQSRRAPSEQWVERFARVYTPAVMAMAVAVFLLPPLLVGASWVVWLYRSLVLLVIACPCALVISTPVSIVAALASAARRGVLLKGGVYVEAPSKLRAIAFDKTGTLTTGVFGVLDLVPLAGRTEIELLQRAAALESHSNHPLARAIVAHANQRNVAIPSAEDCESIPGKGVRGRIEGVSFWLGSPKQMAERQLETAALSEQLEQLRRAGRTVVIVGDDRQVWGVIGLADAPRPEAAQALQQLRAAGVGHLIMLTGDNQDAARAVAKEVGVDEVFAGLLPEEKVDHVQKLVERYKQVAMVGDGVNDAPALSLASVGIAMGVMGSDAAIETADIALMSDDLSKLPWLIGHSRRTLAIIRQNIVFSLAVKAAVMVLALVGVSSLGMAIAADMGVSLLVIFNSLRLLRAAVR